MTAKQMDELLEAIAEQSHELCHMIEKIQEVEGKNPSDAWLSIFNEITQAWFANDSMRLREIHDFIVFGSNSSPITSTDLKNMIFGPGPLTNH